MTMAAEPMPKEGPAARLGDLLERWREDDVDTCLFELDTALKELEKLAGVQHRDEGAREHDVQEGEQWLEKGLETIEVLRNLLEIRA